MKDEKELDILKKSSFYAAVYNGWFATNLEHDKSILTLSSSAVGLLFTLLLTVKEVTFLQLILFLLAFLGFGISILYILAIFRENTKVLEYIDDDERFPSYQEKLIKMDVIVRLAFSWGVLMICIIGISFGLNKLL